MTPRVRLAGRHGGGRPDVIHALFLNENIGGHATVHHHLREALRAHPDVKAHFVDLPPADGWSRAAGASLPVMGRLDLDLQPLRAQLVRSWAARRAMLAELPGADIVHVYTQNAALLSAGLLRSTPSVIATDSTNALNAYRLPYRAPTRFTPGTVRVSQLFERRALRAADAVVAHSDFVAASLRTYGIRPPRLRVFPYGLLAPATLPVHRPGKGLVRLAFVGRQLERKGGLRVLDVHQKHFADVAELVFITPEDVPRARNVRVISDVRPGDGRIWDLLADVDALVFPSPIDQAPNVVLEAMAMGLPTIVADAGSMPEMVSHGVTGWVVRPDDDRSLREAMDALIADASRRASMGELARRHFLDRYDMRRSTASLVELFAEVLERRRWPRRRLERSGLVAASVHAMGTAALHRR